MAEGIEYHVRAILEASGAKKQASAMQKFSRGFMKSADAMDRAGQRIAGNTIAAGKAFAVMAGSATVLAGAAGFGALVAGAVRFNVELENTQYTIATTLQLMDHSVSTFKTLVADGMDPANAAAEQFRKNLEIGETTMDRLFMIAAKSPASFDQARIMFQNMLPGARAVTDNMQSILDLSKESLALGLVMGGDFATTGAQLSRILTGGAGAEFQTWKVLQKPILDAGQALGYFGENMQMGEKLTREFNRLAPEKRYELIRSATKKLGTATEALGETWTGLTSTIFSDFQIIQKEIGQVAFSKLKDRFKSMVGEGGVLDPTGQTMQKLRNLGASLGSRIGEAADYFAGKMEGWISYLADNWPSIIARLQTAFDTGLRAATLFVKVAAARAVVGGGLMAAGRVGKAAGAVGGAAKGAIGGIAKLLQSGGAAGSIAKLGPAIMSMGSAALFALPIFLVGAAALVGVAAAGGAIVMAFVSRWDEILKGVRDGTITIGPLLDAFESMLDGLRLAGEEILGFTDTTSGAQGVINMAADAVYSLTGALAVGMKIAGAFQYVFNAFTAGLRVVKLGFLAVITGFAHMIRGLLRVVADAAYQMNLTGLGDKVSGAADSMTDSVSRLRASMTGTVKDIQQDAKDSTQLWNAADRITEGLSSGKFRKAWASAQKKADKGLGDGGPLSRGTQTGEGPGGPAGNVTNIHKMVVNQDLRNQDPDRVIGAFYKAVDESVRKRTQSTALPASGV